MYCSRCGKKVLDSMLYCPFCGAEIIIPEQESYDDADAAPPEPVKVQPVFSFDLPETPEEAPEPAPKAVKLVKEASVPETLLSWETPAEAAAEAAPEVPPEETPEPEKPAAATPEPEARTAPEPAPAPERPPDRRQSSLGSVVPGHRKKDTLVPDKAAMFLDDADDFDDYDDDADFDDDSDDYDDFEEEVKRASRKTRPARARARRYDEDLEEDDEDEGGGFISRHIRGIVGILLFLILLAVLAFYLLSDSGQLSLAKINATLPLRPEIYSRVAYDCYQSGDYAQSGVYYERALARDAKNFNYASSAAMAYIALGDNDKAAEMLRKCIQLKPEAVEPYVYLLNLYPNAASRPWDVAQLLRQGYEKTGDARLEAARDVSGQG